MSITKKLILTCLTFVSGCSLINKIDVCERDNTQEYELNQLTDGRQHLRYSKAVAPMPIGGSFVTFLSGKDEENANEIRGVLLTPQGAPLPTCGEDGEYTYTERSEEKMYTQASIVPPNSDDETGLLIYGMDDETSMQVYVQQMDTAGCPWGLTGEVQISEIDSPSCVMLRTEELPNTNQTCVSSPQGLRLTSDTYVILWLEVHIRNNSISNRIGGRIIRTEYARISFINTQGTTAPEPPIFLTPINRKISDFSSEVVDGNHIALIWLENSYEEYSTHFKLYSSNFQELTDEKILSSATGEVTAFSKIASAYNGERILAGWFERDENGISRAYAQFITSEGEPIERKPTGTSPFRLSRAQDGEETDIAITTFQNGNFMVAWAASGVSGHNDTYGKGIRSVLLNHFGEVLFANFACDQSDFQLNKAILKDQYSPSLTRLNNGSIMAVWTDEGRNGLDKSSSSIRGVALTDFDLFPIE